MKGKSIVEVLIVFAAFEIMLLVYKSSQFLKGERSFLGWSYLGGSLQILIPLLILFSTRRSFKVYGLTCGLTCNKGREALDYGMTFALVRGVIAIGIGMGPFWILGITLPRMVDALKSVGLGIVILFLILLILRRRSSLRDHTDPPSPLSNVVWLIALLPVPILVGLFTKSHFIFFIWFDPCSEPFRSFCF